VKNANAVQVDRSLLSRPERASRETQTTAANFTPSDFLLEASAIIAVCLGLGVLMRLLLT
jgi:hypothetical protein